MKTKDMSKEFSACGRVWIRVGGISSIGQGRIELLEKIDELGSLRKAAMAMKMSYRKAWSSIDKLNKGAEEPLVILKRGGKEGGLAILTDYGIKVIFKSKQLQSEFLKFIEDQSKSLDE